MEKVARGEIDEEAGPEKEAKPEEEDVPEKQVDIGLEPPAPEFILDVTNLTAIDLYVSASVLP